MSNSCTYSSEEERKLIQECRNTDRLRAYKSKRKINNILHYQDKLLNDEIIFMWENCYYDDYSNDWLSWLFANEYSTIKDHTNYES